MSSGLVLAAESVAQPSEKPRACFCTNSPAVADLCVFKINTELRDVVRCVIDVSDRRTIISLRAETHGTYRVHLLDDEIPGRVEWKQSDLRQGALDYFSSVWLMDRLCQSDRDSFILNKHAETQNRVKQKDCRNRNDQNVSKQKQILGKKLCF